MSQQVVAIIQARLASQRLPGKALMDIAGMPMIQRVVDRVRMVRGLGAIYVTTPGADRIAINAALRRYTSEEIPDYVVGNQQPLGKAHDVLRAYAEIAEESGADVVMRVTGDCPLFDPVIAERVLQLFQDTKSCEYASNIALGYVDGEDVEVFSASALRLADRMAIDAFDREHVTPWMRRYLRTVTLEPDSDRSSLKTSVDTPEDLARVRALVQG